MTDLSRRGVLAGAAALGTWTVAGCGGSDTSDSAATTGTSARSASPSGSAAAAPLAKLADIAVGSAVSVKGASGQPVIVARPTSTTAVAFSASCTHKGCPVKLEGTELACPCHGSRFAAATGKVLNGPAEEPLRAIPVKVAGGDVLPA